MVLLDDILENDVKKAALRLLNAHPKIKKVWRNNTGEGKARSGRRIKFGKKGSGDIIGFLVTGEFFSCETKKPGSVASDEQIDFFVDVNDAGGLAMIIDDVTQIEVKLREFYAKKEGLH